MLASRRWASGYQIIDHPIWCQRRRLIWRVRMSDNPQENRVLKEGEAAQHIRGIGENRTDILKNHLGQSPPVRGRNGLCYGAGRRVAADSLLVV